jgi:hypothetical protein
MVPLFVEKFKSLFNWIIPFVFALAGTTWGNLIFLNEYLLSYRRFFASLIFFVILFLIAYFLLRKVPLHDRKFHPLLVWLIPALIAMALSLQFPGTLAYLENHTLEITAEPGKGAVVFLGIHSGNNDISLSKVKFSEEWEFSGDGYRTNAGGTIQWNGRVSSRPTVTVLTGPEMGGLQLTWDGATTEYVLKSGTPSQSPIITSLPIPWYFKLGYFLISWVFFFLLLFILFLLFRSFSLEKNRVHRRGFWLKYSVPFLMASVFMLLVFFPGMMSGDSLVQWRQAHSLVFSDVHPVFDTLFVWFASHLWNSPAMVALLQILGMGLVLAWGLGRLVLRGLPGKVAWTVAVLLAFLPANLLYSISIWKDVPYAICLLWFSLILVEVYFTRGSSLKEIPTLCALVIIGLFTSLFRHNGLPVVAFSCITLLLVYRTLFKWVILATVAILFVRFLITGPLYSAMSVIPAPAKLTYEPVLYHIAAHLENDPAVSIDTLAAANALLPSDQWIYDPCTSNPITYHPGFNDQQFQDHTADYFLLAFHLFMINPGVDLQAVFNLGAFVYRVNPECQVYISSLYYQPTSAVGAAWIDFAVDDVTNEKSLLPSLVKPLAWLVSRTSSLNDLRVFYVLFWSPVIYLLLFLLTATGFFFYQRRWDFLVFIAPATFQSLSMALLAPVQHTRYQYGLIVISIYMVALFLWAFYDSKKNIALGGK